MPPADQEGIKLEARRSEERDGLLHGDEKGDEHDEYDVEARAGSSAASAPVNSQTADKSQEKPVEYSTSPSVKFGWLSAYFFFSLILTLYNKLVLGVVRRSVPDSRLRGKVAALLRPAINLEITPLTCYPPVPVPLAAHCPPRDLC